MLAIVLITSAAAAGKYEPADSPRPMALRGIDIGRKFDASTSGTINPAPKVPKPRIVTKQEWGGGESSGTMRSHFPLRLTLHHEGSGKPQLPTDDAAKELKALQAYGWKSKGWADIPYHYVIDVNGNIYEARDPMKVGDTNTTYDPSGHLLVTAMGNYELQAPTIKELDAICDLMAWLCDYYNIDPASLRGHMEYADTLCPGKTLFPYVVSGYIEGQVRSRIRDAYLGKSTPKN